MRQKNVLFIWEVPDYLKEYFTGQLGDVPNLNLIFPEDATEPTLLKHAPQAHIIVGWRPSQDLLDRAQQLNLFINPGTGVNHLLKLFQNLDQSRKVMLVNNHGNSYFVAQHVVALLLALMNKLIPHHEWMLEGEWRKKDEDARTIPLRDRQVGLLGYGAINQKVHRFLSGFDVGFSILRQSWKDKSDDFPTAAKKYESDQLHDFLREINILVVAIPHTPQTEGLIGLKELQLLGRDGLLINVARGAIIDQASLFQALKEKIIAGAGIDVWYTYQPEPDKEGRYYPFEYQFQQLDNVVFSPHRAASPFNDLKRWQDTIENIRRVAQGRTDFLNLVDLNRGY